MRLKKVILYAGGIVLFLLGMVVYGVLKDYRKPALNELLKQKQISKYSNTKIVVNKEDYKLHLYLDSNLVKTYEVVFGGHPRYQKHTKEDRYTPTGDYYICEKSENTIYGKILILNYPNYYDAIYGLENKLITQDEYNSIIDSVRLGKKPPMNTKLGGNVGIHGNGEYDLFLKSLPFILNWTDGGIALSNSEIKELYGICKVGTKVSIY